MICNNLGELKNELRNVQKSSVVEAQNLFEKITSGKKTILVVDDDMDILELQKVLLEMEGFEVFTARGGKEALTVLGEIKKPKLILLDVQMEDMSGMEFLNLLEKKNPEIFASVPVVFLTGMDQIPVANVRGFIRKPFENNNFLKAIYHFIETGSPTCHLH